MNCTECQTRNPIGSRFCRLCGTALAVPAGSLAEEEARIAELERAREQAAELLTRAHKHGERHEYDAAIPLAEEAARLLPDSTAAHALLATLYERAHRTDDAVRAMEKVVELNPDSEVDRDKLVRLRRGVHFVPEIAPEPEQDPWQKRWLPWMAGVGATALVMGMVSLLPPKKVRPLPNRTTVSPTSPIASPIAGPNPSNPAPTQQTTLLPMAQAGSADPFVQQNPQPTTPTPAPAPSPTAGATPNPTPAPPAGPGLPGLGTGATTPGQPDPTIRPVPPVVIPAPSAAARPPRDAIAAAPPPAGDPAAPIAAGPPSGATERATPPASSQSGYIRVEFHDKNKDNSDNPPAGRQGGPRSEPAGDPMLKAQALQSTGKWREAIAWFRNAQLAGADAGECQQGIALCHQRLGEWDAARTAYKQALDAYARHRGTPRWRTAERGWTACRAALEVLGG